MAKSKQPIGEPLAGVVIDGTLHQVPASRVPLEEAIAEGARLETEITRLQEQAAARGTTTEQLIKGVEADLKRLQDDLARERGPILLLAAPKQARLDQVKTQLLALARPLIGDQKSIKIVGIAGTIQVERTPKMTVAKDKVPALKKLLGDLFVGHFETEEKVTPLKAAWNLLRTLKGARLDKFKQLVTTEDSGRVRFVPGGK